MIPTPMLPTESSAERKLYEGLREQLPDDLVVYHGVKWLQLGDRAREGESDFLIADPHRGILCVEVKGGALSFDPATRTWQQNGHPLKKDPFAQAQETVHWLEQRMKTVPGWSKWKAAFGYAVAFPDGDYKIEAHPNSPLDITIDRRDMDTLADRVAKIMGRWGNAQPAAAAEGMRALLETMGYRIEVIAPLGVRFDDAERTMIELTEEQSYIRDFVRRQPRLAVMGTAGSGKTLIAIQTAVWLAQNGRRTLFTCLNKRLGRYIAEMTAEEENIRASHFHALAYELAREADLIEEQSDQALPGETTYFSDDLPARIEAGRRGPRHPVRCDRRRRGAGLPGAVLGRLARVPLASRADAALPVRRRQPEHLRGRRAPGPAERVLRSAAQEHAELARGPAVPPHAPQP